MHSAQVESHNEKGLQKEYIILILVTEQDRRKIKTIIKKEWRQNGQSIRKRLHPIGLPKSLKTTEINVSIIRVSNLLRNLAIVANAATQKLSPPCSCLLASALAPCILAKVS